jgi:purine-cytosine permease-like protein
VKNPWNLVFFRKPWLAFLAAFLPMMLIVAFVAFYSYRMRSKNRIISVARDKLDTALRELKMAQDKLLAAEKFRQAKDIAGGFAHEIRNALFPARASLSRLKRARTPGPR